MTSVKPVMSANCESYDLLGICPYDDPSWLGRDKHKDAPKRGMAPLPLFEDILGILVFFIDTK